jgi:hypothetical protein
MNGTILQTDKRPRGDAVARGLAMMLASPMHTYTDQSRPWLGPPSHSQRVKAKRRARRMRGGR